MYKISKYSVCFCIAFFITFADSLSVQATTFSYANLNGNYSFMLNIFTTDINTNQSDTIGVLSFNGKGQVNTSYVKISGGVFSSGTCNGYYSVNSNGTGVITNTTLCGQTQYEFALNSILSGIAQGFQFIRINNNNNIAESGEAIKQNSSLFNNTNLSGNYSFLLNRLTANTNSSEIALQGVMTFNGNGKVTSSYVSAPSGGTGFCDGTYSVNKNGIGAIIFETGCSSNQYSFVINLTTSGIAKGFQIIQTNDTNNEIESGAAIKQ